MKYFKLLCLTLCLALLLSLVSCTDGAGQISSDAGSEANSTASSAVSEESVVGTVSDSVPEESSGDAAAETNTRIPYIRTVNADDGILTLEEAYPDEKAEPPFSLPGMFDFQRFHRAVVTGNALHSALEKYGEDMRYEVNLKNEEFFIFDGYEELVESGLLVKRGEYSVRLTSKGFEDRLAYAKSLGYEIFYSVETRQLTEGAVQTVKTYYANLTHAEMEKLAEYGGYSFNFAFAMEDTEFYVY